MSRIKELTRDELTDEQGAVWDKITGGPRGGNTLRGPFNALMRAPKLCDLAQELGAYIRFGTAMSGKLRELAIIVTARHWGAQYEWYAHSRIAAEEGLGADIIDAIAERRRPDFSDPDEAVVYDFSHEVLATTRASDATYEAAHKLLGDAGLADLVGLLGYYSLVALTLNVYEVPLPPDAKPLEL